MTKFKQVFGVLFGCFVFANGYSVNSTVDYSKEQNWAVTPNAYPSSLMALIKDSIVPNTDVFYVYPTLYTQKSDTGWNIAIDNKTQQKKVLNSAVKYQASAWANAGKLYVPYYRQAHIRSYSNLKGKGRDALMVAYSDVKAAFEYYLKNYNKGRGIILAGHSQGSTHLTLLIKDFFDGKPLQDQLIAAYLPGVGVKTNEFNSIELLTHQDSIGGFVTWNTFKRKYKTPFYRKWYSGKAAINPVTWDTLKTANKKLHKGFLYTNDKTYRNSFTTHLISGGVWISTPRFPHRYLAFTMKNYHIGDVNLFWEDIRINARNRAKKYQTFIKALSKPEN